MTRKKDKPFPPLPDGVEIGKPGPQTFDDTPPGGPAPPPPPSPPPPSPPEVPGG